MSDTINPLDNSWGTVSAVKVLYWGGRGDIMYGDNIYIYIYIYIQLLAKMLSP